MPILPPGKKVTELRLEVSNLGFGERDRLGLGSPGTGAGFWCLGLARFQERKDAVQLLVQRTNLRKQIFGTGMGSIRMRRLLRRRSSPFAAKKSGLMGMRRRLQHERTE